MFKCVQGCKAECCGIVPIPKRTWKKHKYDIQRKVDSMVSVGNNIIILSTDGTCAYLDSTGKCAIYNDRPPVCKRYGIESKLPCLYIRPDGTARTAEESTEVQRKISNYVDEK